MEETRISPLDFSPYIEVLVKRSKNRLKQRIEDIEKNEEIRKRIKDEIERDKKFLDFYNRVVIEKNKIENSRDFIDEFANKWRLVRGTSKEFRKKISENLQKIRKEAENNDMSGLVKIYAELFIDERNRFQGSFFAKLLHTLAPENFPPVDLRVRELLGLQNCDYLISIFVIKEVYDELKDLINTRGRKILREIEKDIPELRVDELSHTRVADIILWGSYEKK